MFNLIISWSTMVHMMVLILPQTFISQVQFKYHKTNNKYQTNTTTKLNLFIISNSSNSFNHNLCHKLGLINFKHLNSIFNQLFTNNKHKQKHRLIPNQNHWLRNKVVLSLNFNNSKWFQLFSLNHLSKHKSKIKIMLYQVLLHSKTNNK